MGPKTTRALPSLKEVLEYILSKCFPNESYTPTKYAEACKLKFCQNEYPIDLGMSWDEFEKSELGELCYKLEAWDPIPVKKFDLKASFFSTAKSVDECLNNGLAPFIEKDDRSLARWLQGKPKEMQDRNLYKGACFYAIGLLSFADCDSYVERCYEWFGLNDDITTVLKCSVLMDWKKELVLYLTYVLLGCSQGPAWTEQKLLLLQAFINEKMQPFNQAMLAEKAWITDVSAFRPRSVEDKKGGRLMQDFYVSTDFSGQNGLCEQPMAKLTNSNHGTKQLIVARTGMGKSMYIRMAALSMCRELLPNSEKIERLVEKVPAPTDKYVVYIPAYMFSYCFQKDEYKLWTEDFITLYFNCMFRLSGAIDFDKRELRKEYVEWGLDGCEISDKLLDFVKKLAIKGELVLLADSFDEIVSGDMRDAYLAALRKYKDKYCNFPENVGAHILVTSREMALTTMEDLATAMGIKMDSDCVMRIQPLSVEKQKELILNWDQYYRSDIKDNLRQLSNHFFTDMGSNPYMLSIICCFSGAKMKRIFDKLIPSILNYRIGYASNALENELLRTTLKSQTVRNIMQDLAYETVRIGDAHFSLDLLAKQCQTRFMESDISQEEFEYCLNEIISLFTTAVGLIVPADQDDERFQFLSDPIRFELATSRLYEKVRIGEETTAIQNCISFLQKLDDEDYINMIVPLICKISGRAPVAEALVCDLILRSFEKENEWLINRALVDIILCRYDNNITNVTLNKRSPDYKYCLQADRLIIMRLLTAPGFNPTEGEQLAIIDSNAFKACDGFVNKTFSTASSRIIP